MLLHGTIESVSMGSVVKGPLKAHVYRQDESKGLMEEPL